MRRDRQIHICFLCLLFLASLIFCGDILARSVLAKSNQTEENVDDIILRLSMNKVSYGKEDIVRFDLEIENGSDYRIRSTDIQWKMSKGLELDSGKRLRTALPSIISGNKQKISGILAGDPEIFGHAVSAWFVKLILILDFVMIISAMTAIAVIKDRDSRTRKHLSAKALIFLMILSSAFGGPERKAQASEADDAVGYRGEKPSRQPASQQSSWITTEEREATVTLEFEYADEPVKIQAVLHMQLESYEEQD